MKQKLKPRNSAALGPLLVVILLMVALMFITNFKFVKFANLMNILRQVSINSLVALGMLMVLLTGGIDLSVGSIVGFSTCIMATLFKNGVENALILLVVPLLLGVAIGALNGILYTKLQLPHPFVVTLGTQSVLRGLVHIISNSLPVNNFPEWVRIWGGGNLFGDKFPIPFIIVIIAVILVSIFLTKTSLGRKIYIVGGNLEAARLSGIDVDAVRIFAYAFIGFMAAVAGVVLVGRVNSFSPNSGEGYEMNAIAACVIGGASFNGGKGTATGTLVGAFFITIVNNGLNLLGASSNMQLVVVGVVIVFAVVLDVQRTKMAEKRRLQNVEKAIAEKKEAGAE